MSSLDDDDVRTPVDDVLVVLLEYYDQSSPELAEAKECILTFFFR